MAEKNADEFIEGCSGCETGKFSRTAFGLFGLDYIVTKRMMNRLLAPHGLKLKVATNRRKWGDQSEVKIVKAE